MKTTHSYPVPDKKKLRLWYPPQLYLYLHYTEPNTDSIWPNIYFSWKPPTHILSQTKTIKIWYPHPHPCVNFFTPVSRRAVLCDWVWQTGVRTGFCTITLVLYIGSLPNLATWFPFGRGRILFILGSLGQRSPLL
jgi:hypothetical protein